MKWGFFAVVFLLGLIPFGAVAETETELTVYTEEIALVKEVRELDLEEGLNRFELTDIPFGIDPTSVYLRSLSTPGALTVLEQHYEYDLANSAKLLERYLGEQVRIFAKGGEVYEGRLLSPSPRDLILETAQGEIRLISQGEISHISLPRLPEGFVTRPTLVWLLDSAESGTHKVELAYLTTGINWQTEYVAVMDEGDSQLELSGWASVDNRSGRSYEDTRLRLVAGEVHRVRERVRVSYMAAAKAGEPQFEEEPLYEYHLYTLDRPFTLENNQVKQLSLFPHFRVSVEEIYSYDASRDPKRVEVVLEFENSRKVGPGRPLPRGKIRVYKRDSVGSLQFIGEDLIDHTPVGEKVRVVAGSAFDILGERKVMDHRRISKRILQEKVQIKLTNRKDKAVDVLVTEHLAGDWEILRSSIKYRKKDANTIEFKVPVRKDGEAVVEYTVQYRR